MVRYPFMKENLDPACIYYWGFRLPLPRLPFTLVLLAESFPQKTHAPQRTTLLRVGEYVYNSRNVCMFSWHGLARGNLLTGGSG